MRILLVDDDDAVRDALRMTLAYENWDVVEADSGEAGLDLARRVAPDVVLLDVKMPRMDGLEVLAKLGELDDPPPVVMVSGHADIATAVEATKLGAFDFLEKPVGRDRLLLTLRNAIEKRRLEGENRRLRQESGGGELVGTSAAMRELERVIARAAPTSATVLIRGPSGSGKELVARRIHDLSKRSRGAFVRVNCAAIPDELVESELFGHEKGSFTGASRRQAGKFLLADGGTIFLDEIGDLSARAQAKVLRALQEGEIEPVGAGQPLRVDARVLAATHRDLEAAISAGAFREDLYYRLNVVPIEVPPLAARASDIPDLVAHFAARFAAEIGRAVPTFEAAAMQRLASHAWPGNVRELANLIERLLILIDRDRIQASDLIFPASAGATSPARVPVDRTLTPTTLQEFKDGAEREFIRGQLEAHGWNVSATADAIATPRSNLYKKIEQFGLKREDAK